LLFRPSELGFLFDQFIESGIRIVVLIVERLETGPAFVMASGNATAEIRISITYHFFEVLLDRIAFCNGWSWPGPSCSVDLSEAGLIRGNGYLLRQSKIPAS
jgi:hypothetical protein